MIVLVGLVLFLAGAACATVTLASQEYGRVLSLAILLELLAVGVYLTRWRRSGRWGRIGLSLLILICLLPIAEALRRLF